MRKILIALLLLMPVQMLGQLGRNALPGGLEIFTVYESTSPSLTKILEYVANLGLPDEHYDIDFLDKVLTFERNIFKNFVIKVMRPNSDPDYDFVIAIANYSGFGKMNMSRNIRSKYVINVNNAHFFFCLNHDKSDRICDEFITEFLRPTNETYGCRQIDDSNYFSNYLSRFHIKYYILPLYDNPVWICERNENLEWQITYRSIRWPSEWSVFINIAPSNAQLSHIVDGNYKIHQKRKGYINNYRVDKVHLMNNGDRRYCIVPNNELMEKYFNDLPKACRESAKKETIINEKQ